MAAPHVIEADEYERRLKLCFAELGFQDVPTQFNGWSDTGVPLFSTPAVIPLVVAYMAARMVLFLDHGEVPVACWGCFQLADAASNVEIGKQCRLGNCTSGGPEWPSWEEIRRATPDQTVHEPA